MGKQNQQIKEKRSFGHGMVVDVLFLHLHLGEIVTAVAGVMQVNIRLVNPVDHGLAMDKAQRFAWQARRSVTCGDNDSEVYCHRLS